MKNFFKKILLVVAFIGISPSMIFAAGQDLMTSTSVEFSHVFGSYVLPDPVGAIEGRSISKNELNSYLKFTQDLEISEVNDPFISKQLLHELGAKAVLAKEAQSRGLDQNESYQLKLALMKQYFLAEILIEDLIKKEELATTDMRAQYDTYLKGLDKYEYDVRHLVVDTREQALAILNEINKKEISFVDAVKKYSQDESSLENDGKFGGWFSLSRINDDIAIVLKEMKEGEISTEPVESEFGYHVLSLDGLREIERTPFESLDMDTLKKLAEPHFQDYVNNVGQTITVELPETK